MGSQGKETADAPDGLGLNSTLNSTVSRLAQNARTHVRTYVRALTHVRTYKYRHTLLPQCPWGCLTTVPLGMSSSAMTPQPRFFLQMHMLKPSLHRQTSANKVGWCQQHPRYRLQDFKTLRTRLRSRPCRELQVLSACGVQEKGEGWRERR